MPKSLLTLLSLALLSACGHPDAASQLGDLSLALSTQAGGVTYRLVQADFALAGAQDRAFSVEGSDPISLTLPIGSYTLALDEGWVLARTDDQAMTPVAATLESQNPAPFVIGPGATTALMLRFALADGTKLNMATGTLTVGVSLADEPDAGRIASTCTHGLLVNEIDYEQSGADDAEFVEIVNTAECDAALAGVQLELVNGGDSKVYGRIALSLAADSLPAGSRLVVGSAKILTALPAAVLRAPLGSAGLQNGAPDAVRIVEGNRVLDALAYEGSVAGSVEGSGAAADEGDGSLSRCPDNFDSQDNAIDFQLVPATPGAVNACP